MKKSRIEEFLTNEPFAKAGQSSFGLVLHAIRVAENMIQSGRDARVKVDSQSRAVQILAEIYEGRDELAEIYDDEDDEGPAKVRFSHTASSDQHKENNSAKY